MNELKLKISNLSDYDEYTLGSLLSDINVHGNGEKDDEVYELVDLFVKKIKANLVGQIENGFLTKDSAIKELKKVKKLIKEYIDITGVRKIYADNDFDNKSLKNVQELSVNEIDKKGKDVMNGVNDIKQRIDGFHEINDIDDNTLESVIGEIVALNENQEREESYADLTGKIWRILSQEFMDKKIDVADFNNKVGSYRDKLKTYAGFSDNQVDDLFREHGLDMNPENLIAGNVQSQDVSRTGNSGSSSSNVGDNVSSINTTSTGDSGNNGSTSNDGSTTDVENQERADEKELSQEEIEKEIAELEAELADVFTAAEAANMTPRDYLNAEIKKIEEQKSIDVKEINSKIKDLKAETNEYKLEILENQARQLDGLGIEGDNPDLLEINNEIRLRNMSFEELSIEKSKMISDKLAIISNYSSHMTDEEKNQLDAWKNAFSRDWYTSAIKDVQTKIAELETERSWMEVSHENERLKEIDKELNDLHKKLNYYTKNKNGIDEFKQKSLTDMDSLIGKYNKDISDNDKKKLTDIDKQVKLIDECIIDKNNSIKNKEELNKLDKQLKDIQSQADKKVASLQDKINKLDRLDYLKSLLKRKQTNEQTDGKQKRKDLFYKSLAGVAGFGLGFGLAFVPGYGTVKMSLAVAKLVGSVSNTAINAWTKKHPEGKIAKIVNTVKHNKVVDKVNNFVQDHPKIANGVNKFKKVIKSPYTKWFTNGMAIGYIAGSMVDSSGILKQKPQPQPSPQPSPQPQPQPTPPSPPSGFEIGDTLDVSSISEGFVDSFGNGQTHLMTEIGKNVEIVGEENGMYALRSLIDNELYAWIPKDEVDALMSVAKAAGRTGP